MDSLIRSRYSKHDPALYAFKCEGESKTQQQFKAECDVNNIMAKYKKTQMITHLAKHQGQFGDFSNLEDYQTSLHKVMLAHDSFAQLPSELRSRFQNDPAQLIQYLSDSNNNEEAYKLGLKIRPPARENIGEALEAALEKNDKKRAEKAEKKS